MPKAHRREAIMANTSNGSVRTIDTAYHKLLDSDSHPVPESYRRDSPIEPGPTFVPVERYISTMGSHA